MIMTTYHKVSSPTIGILASLIPDDWMQFPAKVAVALFFCGLSYFGTQFYAWTWSKRSAIIALLKRTWKH